MIDLSSVRGASAKCIAGWLTGQGCDGSYPHDADDFARCEAVLDAYPELQKRFLDMASVNAYWSALVPAWPDIRRSEDRYSAIKKIIGPIEAEDPSACSLGNGVTLRFGGSVNYKGKDSKKGPKMKETEEDKAVRRNVFEATGDELRQFVERFEQLEAEKKDVMAQQKEVLDEAKGRGFDKAAIKKIIARRKRKPDQIAEEEAVLETYLAALGMI